MSEPVFVDTSFWIAVRDARDTHHVRSWELLRELFARRTVLVVTLPVLAEIHAYFVRSRSLREQVLADFWRNPVVRLEDLSFQDQEEAVTLLRQQRDKEYSFCDALSFVVMRRLGLRRVAAWDRHFQQFGEFEVLV